MTDLAGGWTVGVEEEFLLADPDTRRTVPAAARMLRAAREPAADAGVAVHAELQATQVEAATSPCVSLDEIATQVVAGRRVLAGAAADLLLVPSGTAVLAEPEISAGQRFHEIAQRYAGVVADYEACGCHVHVGVADLETAVGVVNHVRPWLPTLLALSVNSPVHHGADTGYASWRIVQQSRFPGAGVPPLFTDARDHAARVDRLVSTGVLIDATQSFWLVRPSTRFPTVEFRVADVAVETDGAVLQAALSRALVRTALADLARGRPVPELDDQVAAAAVWSAARYGLDGPAVHPVLACRVPATDLVTDLLDTVRPALAETGDTTLVDRLLSAHVSGAERQRAAGTPEEIVTMLAKSALVDGTAHA